MQFKFQYKYPLSRKIVIVISLLLMFYLLFLLVIKSSPTLYNKIVNSQFSLGEFLWELFSWSTLLNLIDFIFSLPDLLYILAFLSIPFIYLTTQIHAYRKSRKYDYLRLDRDAITFPFKIDKETITWNYRDIDYMRFGYRNRIVIQYNYIELVRGEKIIILSKSWMKCNQYNRFAKFLLKQNIPVKSEIPKLF